MIERSSVADSATTRGPLSRATVGNTVFAGVGLIALAVVWDGGPTTRFLLGSLTVLTIQFVIVRRTLVRARLDAGPQPLTLATWITIARGSALALLAGFVVVDPPTGTLVWMPGALFAIAAGLDAVDGVVARRTDSVTEFGARLDTEIDALTVLCGAAIVVLYGVAPVAFLAVGLARYAFVAGIAVRRRRGLSVRGLDRSQARRFLGALAMVAIWLALLPVPGRTGSWLVTAAVLVPFLLQFGRDWLVVSGRLERRTD